MLPSDTADILPLSGYQGNSSQLTEGQTLTLKGKGFVKPLPTQGKTLYYSMGVKSE